MEKGRMEEEEILKKGKKHQRETKRTCQRKKKRPKKELETGNHDIRK